MVEMATISVVTWPMLAGQLVTSGAQDVTVYMFVEYTVDVVYDGVVGTALGALVVEPGRVPELPTTSVVVGIGAGVLCDMTSLDLPGTGVASTLDLAVV